MSEQVEVFQAMREATREKHREWHRLNREVLQASGLAWKETNRGECLTFRALHFRADFYPSTGRWRSGGKTYSGGAAQFLAWYKRQTA